MSALWEWLIGILDRLRFWFIVQPNEGAVRTFCGRRVTVLGPGLHWICPILGEGTVAPITEQVIDIRSQSLTTMDNIPVAIGVSIAYEVKDAEKAILRVQDWDESLANEALRVVGQFVSTHNYDDCLKSDVFAEQIIKDLKEIATRRWGLKIIRVGLSDLVKCKAFRIMGIERQAE